MYKIQKFWDKYAGWLYLAWLIATIVGTIMICKHYEDQNRIKNESKPCQEVDTIKREKYSPPLYEYPSGAVGTLPHDFETGEKGKPIDY